MFNFNMDKYFNINILNIIILNNNFSSLTISQIINTNRTKNSNIYE